MKTLVWVEGALDGYVTEIKGFRGNFTEFLKCFWKIFENQHINCWSVCKNERNRFQSLFSLIPIYLFSYYLIFNKLTFFNEEKLYCLDLRPIVV